MLSGRLIHERFGGSDNNICTVCGKPYEPDDNFCRHCGSRLVLRLSEMPEEEQEQYSKKIEAIIDCYLAMDSAQEL